MLKQTGILFSLLWYTEKITFMWFRPKMNNLNVILGGTQTKIEGCFTKQAACAHYERWRKAEGLLQVRGDWGAGPTSCHMWSSTGPGIRKHENGKKDTGGIIGEIW